MSSKHNKERSNRISKAPRTKLGVLPDGSMLQSGSEPVTVWHDLLYIVHVAPLRLRFMDMT